MEELAASYGWSLAVLNSNKELKKLFQLAVKETWEPSKFVAKVRDTGWYKKNGEAARQALILRKTDPKEWQRRNEQMKLHIRTLYGSMSGGQKMSNKWLGSAASQAITLGWTEEEIKHQIARSTGYITLMREDRLGGEAGEIEDMMTKAEGDYGFKVSDAWKVGRIRNTMLGVDSKESIMDAFKKYAKSTYGAFAEEIDNGMTIKDIAEPYVQTMGRLLELNPESITVFDSKIRAALTERDPESGKARAMPVWRFENQLREDPRWNQTNNARQAYMSTGHSLLQQFGLVS